MCITSHYIVRNNRATLRECCSHSRNLHLEVPSLDSLSILNDLVNVFNPNLHVDENRVAEVRGQDANGTSVHRTLFEIRTSISDKIGIYSIITFLNSS